MHKPGVTWLAESRADLVSASHATRDLNLKDVTTMSWWVAGDGPTGTLGVAWESALCKWNAINLNEKQSTAAQSAFVRRSYVVELHPTFFQKYVLMNSFMILGFGSRVRA